MTKQEDLRPKIEEVEKRFIEVHKIIRGNNMNDYKFFILAGTFYLGLLEKSITEEALINVSKILDLLPTIHELSIPKRKNNCDPGWTVDCNTPMKEK